MLTTRPAAGLLELRRDRPDLAIQRLDTLRPMLGESPDWKVEMAQLQLLVGDRRAAEQLLEQASEQIDSLRRTPARLALKARIAELRQPH